MDYRKLLVPALLIGITVGALLLVGNREGGSPTLPTNSDNPESKTGEQTQTAPAQTVPPQSAPAQTSSPREESPASEGSAPSLPATPSPGALPTLRKAEIRLPSMPEWYDTAILDVPKESLDQGTDPTIGARTRELPVSGQGLALRVKFRNTGRCTLGDLDIIKNGMLSPRAKLLLTVEPLGLNKAEAAGAVEVGLDTIEGKGAVKVVVPTPKTPTVYGVYLCRDSDDTGLCGAKSLIPPGAPPEPKTVSSAAGNVRPADPIWYFNPVVIRENKITAFKQPYKEPDYYKTLGAMILSIVPAPVSGRNPIDLIKESNDIIRSGSLQLEGSDATIDLPRFEQKRCEELTFPTPTASISQPEDAKAPNENKG